MYDPNYRLSDERKVAPRRGRVVWGRLVWERVGLTLGVALALALGALYGPLLWNQVGVVAEPERATLTTAGTLAPAAQMAASLAEDQEALADLYAVVAPSVVNIQVASRRAMSFGLPDDEGPLQQSQGSGFIYDDQGHIVTNSHVVEDAEDVLVIFHNGFWAEAEVVATDPQADLAVIKVTPPTGLAWVPLPLEDANTLRVGHTVVAIGNPFGLAGTMTTGIVSALGRGLPVGDGEVSRYTLPDVIQTDAAINPGNSGGPLLDLDGRVVGVNFAIRSQVRSNAGVGFAIPVSIVRRVVPALISEGRYAYAYLGMSGTSINAGVADALGLPVNQLGVYVANVVPGGPSEAAGLQGGRETVRDANGVEYRRGGDVVVGVNGIPVQRFEDLVSFLVTQATPGDTITLTVLRDGLRDGETLDVPVVVGERPSGSGLPSAQTPDSDGVNAREAIDLATRAAEDEGLLTAEVNEKVATPDAINGVDVWVVELVTDNETVVVTIDAASGDVLDMSLR